MINVGTALTSFDVIGITDKELGDTLLDRCKNLLRVRDAIHRLGSQTPIHVFGSLDPMTALAYFLCGADIFDGLTWLRFAFLDGIPIYHDADIILEEAWTAGRQEALAARRVANLQWLRTQEKAMLRYCRHHAFENLGSVRPLAQRVLPLVRAAGLDFHG